MTDFVHPGYVRSRNDGDLHWVTGGNLICLNGLNPALTVIVTQDTLVSRKKDPEDRHFYPRYDGNYGETR